MTIPAVVSMAALCFEHPHQVTSRLARDKRQAREIFASDVSLRRLDATM